MAQTIYPDQPPPKHGPDSVPVWPVAIAGLKSIRGVSESLIQAAEERAEVGIENYGVPLCTNDERVTKTDSMQEALDLTAYLQKMVMERSGKRSQIDAANALWHVTQAMILIHGIEE
jgi:hypothetical protein